MQNFSDNSKRSDMMNKILKTFAAIVLLSAMSGCATKDRMFEYDYSYVSNETECQLMVTVQALNSGDAKQTHDTTLVMAPHDQSDISVMTQSGYQIDNIRIFSLEGELIRSFSAGEIEWKREEIDKSEPEKNYWCYIHNRIFVIKSDML